MTLHGFLILFLLLSRLDNSETFDDDDDDDDVDHKRPSTKDQKCIIGPKNFYYRGHDWSSWSSWSECSVSCGVGVRMRNRKCTDGRKAANDVSPFLCQGDSKEEITCSRPRCPNDKAGKAEAFNDQTCGEGNTDNLNDNTADTQAEYAATDNACDGDGVNGNGGNIDEPHAAEGAEDFDDLPDDDFQGHRQRADSLGDGGASDRGQMEKQHDDNADAAYADDDVDNNGGAEDDANPGDQDGDDGPAAEEGGEEQGEEQQQQGQEKSRENAEEHDDHDDDHDDVMSQGEMDNSAEEKDDEGDEEEDGKEEGKTRKGKKRFMEQEEEEEEEEEEDKDEEEEKEDNKKKKKKKKKKKRKRKRKESTTKDKATVGMTSADEHSPESLCGSPSPTSELSANRLKLKPPSEDVLRIRCRSSGSESDTDSDSLVSYEESPDSDSCDDNVEEDKVSLAETEGSVADNEASFRDDSVDTSRNCSLEDIRGVTSSASVNSLQKILDNCNDSLKEISDRCTKRANSLSDIGDVLNSLDSQPSHASLTTSLNTKDLSSASLDISSSSNEIPQTALEIGSDNTSTGVNQQLTQLKPCRSSISTETKLKSSTSKS